MPDLSKSSEGKKFMWDGVLYETEKEAQDVKAQYEADGFETLAVAEEDKFLVYSRRVVKEIVLEGESPP